MKHICYSCFLIFEINHVNIQSEEVVERNNDGRKEYKGLMLERTKGRKRRRTVNTHQHVTWPIKIKRSETLFVTHL